jgi:hypothetical protein
MSLLRTIRQQLGLSVTPANNFTITAEADNGTLKLARGNAGATTQDILTVDAAGKVAFPFGAVIGEAGTAFKTKVVTGTTAAAAGGNSSPNTGVTSDKIMAVYAIVNENGVNYIPPNYADPTRQYSLYIAAGSVNIALGASATNILSKPVSIFVIYLP